MQKTIQTASLLLLFSGLAESQILPTSAQEFALDYCADQAQLSSTCVQSCKNPAYDNCGDVFPAIYDPRYCGYLGNGQWRSYTFACQACKGGALGVLDGKCSCNLEPCPDGKICQLGQCVDP